MIRTSDQMGILAFVSTYQYIDTMFEGLVGIILFCGGIYAAFGPQAAAAKPLIPLGGASFMLGWVLFAAGAFFLKRS